MRDYDQLKASAFEVIDRYKDELFELNKWIFDKKELSCQEYETSAKLVETLRGKGYTVVYPFAGMDTAFFAEKPTEKAHSRKIAIRVLEEIYEELGLPLDAPNSRFGSTDAGNVSWVCPTFHPLLEAVPHEVSIHQKDFASYMTGDRAYEALQTGAKIIALQCLRIFTDPGTHAAMKADFAASVKKG